MSEIRSLYRSRGDGESPFPQSWDQSPAGESPRGSQRKISATPPPEHVTQVVLSV